jgi:aminopeptidase N
MNRLFLFLCFSVNILVAQQTQYVDFKHIESLLLFNQIKVDSTVFNSYQVKFDVLKPTDSVYLDAINMKFMNVALDKNLVEFKNDGKKLIIYHKFKAYTSYKLNFLFFASPKKAMYFIGWDNASKNQVWTQGQGKYTSNWLPSIDDMNDKIEFDLTIVAPKGYQVISNGKMVSKRETTMYNLWQYDMQKPMSSYLVALVIGQYNKKVEFSKSGIPLEMYYYPEDSLKFEPTYRYSKQMLDFLEQEIGVNYPWQNYKQVPVKDFLYAGMENTSATIFSDSFVIDSMAFIDKNYVNVNAHELAHQWFGDLVTESSGTHHWLQEGFATYYALLAERYIFGDNYYYWQLYDYAQELLQQDQEGQSTALLDPKSSSTTFYKKGAWALHILREKVGDKAFKLAVKNYLEKYAFKNVKTEDFIFEVEQASGLDLKLFVANWLEAKTFFYQDCINNLKSKSEEVLKMLQLDEQLLFSSESLNARVNKYWEQSKSQEVRRRLFLKDEIRLVHDSIYKKAIKSNIIKVRQAVALSKSEISEILKSDYESLLNDKSYVTIEAALYNLWQNFPQERKKYLDRTDGIHGFNDKNIRILWLTLALISENYKPELKKLYFDELTSYTSPVFSFEIRQNAFQYLTQIQACNTVCKDNLKRATKHHNWRFSKFAKELMTQNQ